MISRRILGELRKEWSEGINSDNTAVIDNIKIKMHSYSERI